jgi:rubredoxin
MSCPECGFEFDPDNESQVVCPACGADPTGEPRLEDDPTLAAALEDGAAFAEAPVELADMLGENAPTEPEIDYAPDPELDLAIADAKALTEALTEGPILVAGNRLIN